jgi:chaperonin GroES
MTPPPTTPAQKTVTATQFEPLQDRVLVRPFRHETQSVVLPGVRGEFRADIRKDTLNSAIAVVDQGKEKPYTGRVIAVGPGAYLQSGQLIPPGVDIGDEVMYGKYAGSDIDIDGNKLVVLGAAEILGKVRKVEVPIQDAPSPVPTAASRQSRR